MKDFIDNGIEIIPNVVLAPYTSFNIGGMCDYLICPKSIEQLNISLELLKSHGIKTFILGNGSNLLVDDDGFDGACVLMNGINEIKLIDETTIIAGAGVSLNKLCCVALENSLTGAEFLWGIPASVGGAIYMNAGAYKGEVKDILLDAMYLSNGNVLTVSNYDLDFAYRHSIFSGKNDCIVSGTFELKKGDKAAIKGKMDEIFYKRSNSQPLDYKSAGSTFKRPHNAFAAELIERCGLKGRRVGGAMVSDKHSGFIVNVNNATSRDVIQLIEFVQMIVFTKTGHRLFCEVEYLNKYGKNIEFYKPLCDTDLH